jgi:hypothetical protein
LEEWGEQLRKEQWQIYNRGDRLGIPRRNSDGRFHARGNGRSLNDRLSKLDRQFEATAEEICSIRTELRHARISRNNAIRRWQAHQQLVVSIRFALCAYVMTALVFALTPWSSQLSSFVSAYMWFDNPAIRGLYGPLVAATVSGALAGGGGFYSNRVQATHELDPSYFSDKRDRDIAKFKQAHDLTAEPDVESDFEDADSHDEAEHEAEVPEEQAARSPYEILGIAENASREEIISAHRQLVKQYHPDLLRSLGPKLQKLGHEETQLLNKAKDDALKQL